MPCGAGTYNIQTAEQSMSCLVKYILSKPAGQATNNVQSDGANNVFSVGTNNIQTAGLTINDAQSLRDKYYPNQRGKQCPPLEGHILSSATNLKMPSPT